LKILKTKWAPGWTPLTYLFLSTGNSMCEAFAAQPVNFVTFIVPNFTQTNEE